MGACPTALSGEAAMQRISLWSFLATITRGAFVAAAIAGWGTMLACAIEAQPPAQDGEVQKLIGELGGANFAKREEATRRLIQVGAAAIEPISQAAKCNDPEVAGRAIYVLRESARSSDAGVRKAAIRVLRRLTESKNRFTSSKASVELESLVPDLKALEHLRAKFRFNDDGDVIEAELLGVRRDSDLAPLVKFSELQRLKIISVHCSDAGLKPLTELKNLLVLEIFGGRSITDDGLKHLGELTRLQELSLRDCSRLTGAGLNHLRRLEQLDTLVLSPGQANDEGFACLTAFPRLREINVLGFVQEAQVTDKGLSNLTVLKSLRRFTLDPAPRITDDGLAALGELPELEQLWIGHAPLTDAGFQHLIRLQNLRTLHFYKCPAITGSGLAHLANARNLERLFLNNSGIEGAHLRHLSGFTHMKRLELDGMKAVDGDLAPLRNLTDLRRLSLSSVNVSDAAVDDLRSVLVDAEIVFKNSETPTASSEFEGRLSDEQKSVVLQIRNRGGKVVILESAEGALVAEVSLANTPANDSVLDLSVLDSIIQLPRVCKLDLARTKISGAGIQKLSALKDLEHLDLSSTDVSDSDPSSLSQLPKLILLSIGDTRLSDAGVEVLSNLTSLRELRLWRLRLSDAALQKLRSALPKCWLVY
jgi:Leucine-rich repeat (LRR) protein